MAVAYNNTCFLLPWKLQSKVSKHEVWCKIISAFRSRYFRDIARQKLLIFVKFSSSCRRLSSGHFFETWCISSLYLLFWLSSNISHDDTWYSGQFEADISVAFSCTDTALFCSNSSVLCGVVAGAQFELGELCYSNCWSSLHVCQVLPAVVRSCLWR